MNGSRELRRELSSFEEERERVVQMKASPARPNNRKKVVVEGRKRTEPLPSIERDRGAETPWTGRCYLPKSGLLRWRERRKKVRIVELL